MSLYVRCHQYNPANSFIVDKNDLLFDDFVSNSNEMCGAHGDRPVEYYCEDDCCAVCAHCVIVGAHRGHQITTIDQQVKTILTSMPA